MVLAVSLLVAAAVTPTALVGQRVSGRGYEGIIVESHHPDDWVPSAQQIDEMEQALPAYARSQLKRWGLDLAKRLPSYRRQYLGFKRNRRRMIAVTFFHENTDVVKSGKWLRVMMTVSGGGDDFLHSLYDASSKRFQEFTINAPE